MVDGKDEVKEEEDNESPPKGQRVIFQKSEEVRGNERARDREYKKKRITEVHTHILNMLNTNRPYRNNK